LPAAHVEVIGAPAATWPAMLCCKCCKSEEEKVPAPSSANQSRSSEQPGMLFITNMGTRCASIPLIEGDSNQSLGLHPWC